MTRRPGRKASSEDFHPFFVTAVLASHFNHGRHGFRQRDVRFVIELFSNWMEASLGVDTFAVQNVQAARFLDKLLAVGWLRCSGRKNARRYQLLRPGVLGLLRSLVERPHYLPLDHFYFVYFFLHCYGGLIRELMADNADLRGASFMAELNALLEPTSAVQAQLKYVKAALTKLDARILEANAAAKIGESGKPLDEVIREIHEEYPYDLNAREPLPSLLATIPEKIQRWEMTQALRHRAGDLWGPLRESLVAHEKILERLYKNTK